MTSKLLNRHAKTGEPATAQNSETWSTQGETDEGVDLLSACAPVEQEAPSTAMARRREPVRSALQGWGQEAFQGAANVRRTGSTPSLTTETSSVGWS